MDEHGGSLPQPPGDLLLLLSPLLPGAAARGRPLPRDPRGGPAGGGAGVQRAGDRLQGYGMGTVVVRWAGDRLQMYGVGTVVVRWAGDRLQRYGVGTVVVRWAGDRLQRYGVGTVVVRWAGDRLQGDSCSSVGWG